MALSTDQQRVFDAICQFIASDKQVFILRGSAGTGKTTLLAHVVEHLQQIHRDFNLMAPTGRAAHILKQKTGTRATTIHRGIYDFEKLVVKINEKDIADSEFKFHYPIRVEQDTPICIVDEGSMVGNRLSEGELWTFGTNHLLDDLLTFAKLNQGGKLIIIGDPHQLPPVKESVSLAMQSAFFEERGFNVQCESLTQIFRQELDSAILKSAENMRHALHENRYTDIRMQEGEEILSISSHDIPSRYLQLFPTPQLGNSVVICYSNATANTYNERIRTLMYDSSATPLQNGDIMMVVSNCYDKVNNDENLIAGPCDIMNGEFVQVLDYSNEEVRTIPVYENGQRIHLHVTFVDVILQLMSGDQHRCKMITEPVLSAPKGTVSITLIKALYIDFCMRHRDLCQRSKSEEFKQAIQSDPYINALRVRYGYAITGHKSQGGEWDSVFVDYDGVSYNEQGMRWMYTASTRARKQLYVANFVNITPAYQLHMREVTRAARKSEYYPSPVLQTNMETPFHDDSHPAYLKNKYLLMRERLEKTQFAIECVNHMQYRERYTIISAQGQRYMVDCMYDGRGEFRPAVLLNDCIELAMLLALPVMPSLVYPPLDYEPTNNSMQYLFELMCDACHKSNVEMIKVIEDLDKYRVIYYLKTSSDYAWITFFVNAKGFITYGAPQSQDVSDEKLLYLIDKIRQLTTV